MQLFGKTEKLFVYQAHYQLTKENIKRVLFVGFPADLDWPYCAVTASVILDHPFRAGCLFLEMVETSALQRRRGYATDLVQVMAKELTLPIDSTDGVTDEGSAFRKHMQDEGFIL